MRIDAVHNTVSLNFHVYWAKIFDNVIQKRDYKNRLSQSLVVNSYINWS